MLHERREWRPDLTQSGAASSPRQFDGGVAADDLEECVVGRQVVLHRTDFRGGVAVLQRSTGLDPKSGPLGDSSKLSLGRYLHRAWTPRAITALRLRESLRGHLHLSRDPHGPTRGSMAKTIVSLR